MKNNQYVLESNSEFERLEKQSLNPFYSYESELRDFKAGFQGAILDAGCGSGIVSRHLAKKYPQSQVVGCDLSEERLAFAAQSAKDIRNLRFQREDLTKTSFKENTFDSIVCRYVAHHLKWENKNVELIHELYRVLKTTGTLCIVEADGLIFNIYPQSPFLRNCLKKLEENEMVDLSMGRKIPQMLLNAGFSSVTWRTEPLEFTEKALPEESILMQERFEAVMPFFNEFLGSEESAKRFVEEYLETFKKPETVYFHHKVIIQGTKETKPAPTLRALQEISKN